MKKLIGMLVAVGMIAIPAAAERTVIPLDPALVELTPVGASGGLRGADVYDNFTPPQTFLTAIASPEKGDDVHMTQRTFTHMHWGLVTVNTVTVTGAHTMVVWFYDNSAANLGLTVSSQTAPFLPNFLAGFAVTVPNNFTGLLTVLITSAMVGNSGPDMWVSFETPGGAVAQFDGMDGGGVPVIGTSDSDVMFTSYSPAHIIAPQVTNNLGLGFGVPEPATICLMAAGALAILRHRRP